MACGVLVSGLSEDVFLWYSLIAETKLLKYLFKQITMKNEKIGLVNQNELYRARQVNH